MIKITLLILTLALTAFSQLPDLKTYELVGTSGDRHVAAMVHIEDRDGQKVLFKGLLARILEMKGDSITSLDPNNWSVSTVFADCESRAFAFRDSKGMDNGEKFDKEMPPNTNIATKNSIMDAAITKACSGLKGITGKDGL